VLKNWRKQELYGEKETALD